MALRSPGSSRGAIALLGALASGGCGTANAPEAGRAEDLREESATVTPPAQPSAPVPRKAPPLPVPMGWCVGWVEAAPKAGEEKLVPVPARSSTQATGRVVLSGTSVPPSPCSYVSKYAANLEESELPDPSWVQLRERDSGRELVLAVALGGASLPSRPGASLIIEELLVRGTPPSGYLMVRDASGEPLLWMAADRDLDALRRPPELSFARGEHVAGSDWECGVWSAYALVVNEGETSTVLPYGEQIALGKRRIFHGGMLRDLMVDRCIGATMANVWVAMSWEAPEERGSAKRR